MLYYRSDYPDYFPQINLHFEDLQEHLKIIYIKYSKYNLCRNSS